MNPTIPAVPTIRILPMSREEPEFADHTAEGVQQEFFLLNLMLRDGAYWYRTRHLDTSLGTMVLFQFDNQIIASAILHELEEFTPPRGDNGEYRGTYHFEVNSIRIFDPLPAALIQQVWPGVVLSHAMHKSDPAQHPAFEQLLTGIRHAFSPSPQSHDLEPPPAQRVQMTVSRIVRDTAIAARVKVLHNYECQLRGCHHTIVLPDGSRYAEAHHIRPLGTPHDGPDVIGNIVCLCPNHHAMCDLGAIRLTSEELRPAPGHVVSQKYIDYHNQQVCPG